MYLTKKCKITENIHSSFFKKQRLAFAFWLRCKPLFFQWTLSGLLGGISYHINEVGTRFCTEVRLLHSWQPYWKILGFILWQTNQLSKEKHGAIITLRNEGQSFRKTHWFRRCVQTFGLHCMLANPLKHCNSFWALGIGHRSAMTLSPWIIKPRI